jgi:hypothetical protein
VTFRRKCSLLVAVVACLAVASCGSDGGGGKPATGDEAAVAGAVKRYLAALGNLDAPGVCESLTDEAQQQVVEQAGSSQIRCAEVFRLGFATMGDEQKRALKDQSALEPFGIEVDGTNATGSLQYNSQTSRFSAEKVRGGWKLSSPGEAEIVPSRR